jgi:LysR family transcriptional regulator, benzoate and cis,cis-muconate-responsive activator of ben and cat genes
MELRHLRYFVTVAQEQNVTRAAALLHISQPALSRQIRDLENEVGVELLERTPNSVRLTPGGKIFLQECRAILNRIENAVEKVRTKSQVSKTVIRIGYAATPAVEILNESMQKFHKLHPLVSIELFDLSSNGILKGVIEKKLDLGVTVSVSPQSFEGVVLEQLGTYDINVAFHKKHRFGKYKQVPLSEIAKEELITFTRTEHPEAIPALQKILRPYTDDPKIVMECDSISSLFVAVESGKGVALGFSTMAKLAGNRIAVRPVTPASLRLPVGVIYNDQRLSEMANEFLSIIKSVKLKSHRSAKTTLIV